MGKASWTTELWHLVFCFLPFPSPGPSASLDQHLTSLSSQILGLQQFCSVTIISNPLATPVCLITPWDLLFLQIGHFWKLKFRNSPFTNVSYQSPSSLSYVHRTCSFPVSFTLLPYLQAYLPILPAFYFLLFLPWAM